MLSEEIVNALGLQLDDQISRSISREYYWAMPTSLVLVGILEGDPSALANIGPSAGSGQEVLMGFVSYEYLDSHELYAPRSTSLLVVAQEGRKTTVDDFLETTILSPHTYVKTYRREAGFLARARQMAHLIFGIVDCLVAVVVALVVGIINQIALTQRLADFGLLHAIGHHKNRLVRRLTLETTGVAGGGWITGLTLSWLALAWLRTNLYEPRGVELNLANLAPLWFTVPIPLAVIAFATLSIARVFARLDAVAIIERGKLSVETRDRRRAVKRSSARPLSAWTFYLRHRRRGLMLVATMALMILGVAFPVFFFSPMVGVQKPFFLNYLRFVSKVSSDVGHTVDPGVTAQIRSHPAVAHVIPAMPLRLAVSIPPLSETGTTIYGVSEDDLVYLVDLYGMDLKEGHLPRARSNEIVLSEALAMNRGLHVGDTVGRPVYERDESIPTEMVIVGFLQQSSSRAVTRGSGQALPSSDVYLGFASSEYLESHERYSSWPVHLLAVPVEGRKAELDAWLEENIASLQTTVETYDARYREMQQKARGMLLVFAMIEGIIAVVAAIALAVLNYIFFSQRREEFGILYAIGHGRPWLVLRTVGETVSVVIVAWLIGAAVCVAGLVLSQVGIYAPKGLGLNFFNAGPWLFTLPIPLAVVAASVATIVRVLSKLDPVSIIERR
jgi:putative ABC transport system permease protein/lipoprotein-releasing system permease protein